MKKGGRYTCPSVIHLYFLKTGALQGRLRSPCWNGVLLGDAPALWRGPLWVSSTDFPYPESCSFNTLSYQLKQILGVRKAIYNTSGVFTLVNFKLQVSPHSSPRPLKKRMQSWFKALFLLYHVLT